jgi:hypothetical protein
MYPLTAPELAIGEVVKHWHRSIAEHPPEADLLTALLRSFWNGTLSVHPPGKPLVISREQLLFALRETAAQEPCDIAFFERDGDLEPVAVELPDGSTEVDLRARVQLPDDRSQWTEDIVDSTYHTLDRLAAHEYPVSFLAGFRVMRVDRDEFCRLCDAQGWPRPGFWFSESRTGPAAVSLASARTKARKWLRDQTRSSKRMSKEGYWAEARKTDPGLSRRAFEGIWAEVVPPSWRQAGAPRRKNRRVDQL